MPEVKPGESQKDYVSRCVGDSEVVKEFPDQKQRIAVCYSKYRQHKKSKAFDNPLSRIIYGLFNWTEAERPILNHAGMSHASSEIDAGHVTKSGSWGFSWSFNGKKLATNGGYSKWCLGKKGEGRDDVASDWAFPISLDGKNVHRQGVIAAKQRAAQAGYTDIETAASSLLDKIDKKMLKFNV